MVGFWRVAFFGELQNSDSGLRPYYRYLVHLRLISASEKCLFIAFWMSRESEFGVSAWPGKWRGMFSEKSDRSSGQEDQEKPSGFSDGKSRQSDVSLSHNGFGIFPILDSLDSFRS